MEKSLGDKIKEYLKIKNEEYAKAKRLRRFGSALKSLNKERIMEFLNDGVIIADYEKEESALRDVLEGYYHYLYEMIDQHRRKIPNKKDREYFDNYFELAYDDLPEELKEILEESNKNIIELLETLYYYGANINHNTYLAYTDSFFSNKRELHEAPSVMKMIMNCFIYSKQLSLIDWILEKEELILEPQMINQALYDYSPDSIELLEKLINRGFKGKEEDLSRYGIHGTLTPLVECITHTDMPYRQGKFDLLWKYATDEEKEQTKENWKMDNIEIPEETVEYGSSGSPSK